MQAEVHRRDLAVKKKWFIDNKNRIGSIIISYIIIYDIRDFSSHKNHHDRNAAKRGKYKFRWKFNIIYMLVDLMPSTTPFRLLRLS